MSSLKDLFGKKSNTISTSISIEEASKEIESIDYIKEYTKFKQREIPSIDYESPRNFARYGSAKEYYKDSFSSIYSSYPYDGSLAERLRWHNESSDLTNYIFENIYPRNNGYINIGKNYGTLNSVSNGYHSSSVEEYISFFGSMNSINANETKKLFEKSNKLSRENSRWYNLDINGTKGITTEFYFKRENLDGSFKQVILDVTNSKIGLEEGRFRIEVHPGITTEKDKFYITLSSGSDGIVDLEIGENLPFLGEWHHYAIAAINQDSSLKVQLFLDGDLVEEKVSGTPIGQIYGAMKANIGALVTSVSGTSANIGWGKLSGSLDEFRFWKIKRTDKEIARNYFSEVGSGTNTDLSNTNLGIYFKFNEGIYSKTEPYNNRYDKNVIDYSGRLSNGTWKGISVDSRSTGSAIVEGGFAKKEFKDPVLYGSHPDLLTVLKFYTSLGEQYDRNNTVSMMNGYPEWIIDEDNETGRSLFQITQIISGFFDELYLKIQQINSLKDYQYKEGKPLPFTRKLLENANFDISDIFLDMSYLETYLNRTETEEYEEKIYNVKNAIYQNIYNNIIEIYRSKGTSKSFKNLFRCFGIDEKIIKLNIYSNDTNFFLEDKYSYKTEEKKFIDFNNVDRFESTIYQKEESGNVNSLGYLRGSQELKYFGSTLETEIFFPSKFPANSPLYYETPFISASLFGMHESTNGTWESTDRAAISVFAIRERKESKNVKFLLSSSYLNLELYSPLFKEVYDDQKWNFSISLRHEKYPYFGVTSGSLEGDYILEFYGVNMIQDIKQESFTLTSSIESVKAEQFFEANKMIYAGAHRQNFSGSLIIPSSDIYGHLSDIKISNLMYWNSYVNPDTIDMRARDVGNYGQNYVFATTENSLVPSLSGALEYSKIPQIETLSLHWNFNTVSASDGGILAEEDDAKFLIQDVSSGSLDSLSSTPIAKYNKYQFTGTGDFFPKNSFQVVSKEYLYSANRGLPEINNSDDLVQILSEDDEVFEKDSKPIVNYFAIEKSMYQVISEDILKWFGTIKEFNNLIGEPKYKYQPDYNELTKLRNMYFNTVQNEPDFEKFNQFYRWIDSAISFMVEKLLPGSMGYLSGVSSMIESHILERNKYAHKLPTIEFKGEPPIGSARSVNELGYRWDVGHRPINGIESNNCLWWLQRAEREGFLNPDRKAIFAVIASSLNRKFNTVYNVNSNIEIKTFEKKREIEIIRREIGFDLSGINYYEFTDLVKPKKDCDD